MKIYFAKCINTYGQTLFDSSAFEDYMNSANVNEPLKFSTGSWEPLEMNVALLKSWSPGHDASKESNDESNFFYLFTLWV